MSDAATCPRCGSAALGTNETIAGTAMADLFIVNGEVEVEHTGDTEVFWDSSTTDERRPYNCRSCGHDFDDDELLKAPALATAVEALEYALENDTDYLSDETVARWQAALEALR